MRRLAAAVQAYFARFDPEDIRRAAVLSVIITLASLVFPIGALAQAAAAAAAGGAGGAGNSAININLGTGAGLTDRIVQLVGLLTVLSLAPSIVIMTTSFVRIVVVLSLLRTALGLQQSPPNAVIISLSLFLSAIVMGPTWQASYNNGVKPLLDHKMELPQAFGEASKPVEQFMLRQVDSAVSRLPFFKAASATVIFSVAFCSGSSLSASSVRMAAASEPAMSNRLSR